MRCVVVNCKSDNRGKASECSYFGFPSDDRLRNKWISFCGRKKFNPNTSFVCMHHFKPDDFMNNLQYEMGFSTKRLLKDGVVPTISVSHGEKTKLYVQRALRIERRENRKTVNALLQNHRSDFIPSQKEDILQPFENIDIATEEEDILQSIESNDIAAEKDILQSIDHTDTATENVDEIESHQTKMQIEETISLDAKVKALEADVIDLKKENKILKEKMEKMTKLHKHEKEEMEKCLAKTKLELACVEERLVAISTKGQMKKIENGIKHQTCSNEDVAEDVSPKMYRLFYTTQLPVSYILVQNKP